MRGRYGFLSIFKRILDDRFSIIFEASRPHSRAGPSRGVQSEPLLSQFPTPLARTEICPHMCVYLANAVAGTAPGTAHREPRPRDARERGRERVFCILVLRTSNNLLICNVAGETDPLMWASRKPGGGGGSGTPGDSGSTRLARGRPRVGAHLAGSVPGVNPHCPGRGSTHFLRRRLVLMH